MVRQIKNPKPGSIVTYLGGKTPKDVLILGENQKPGWSIPFNEWRFREVLSSGNLGVIQTKEGNFVKCQNKYKISKIKVTKPKAKTKLELYEEKGYLPLNSKNCPCCNTKLHFEVHYLMRVYRGNFFRAICPNSSCKLHSSFISVKAVKNL